MTLYMGDKIFIDSNVFIALLNKDDALYTKAVRTLHTIKERGLLPVTSNFVVNEVITVLSLRINKKIAVMFADFVYGDESGLSVITVDRNIELKAVTYLKQFKSKNISFCDCTIFALLELLPIAYIATFDTDFKTKHTKAKIIK